MTAPVHAAHPWPTNADLIADVARLGYIGENVLDLTYGRGLFWAKWAPGTLTANDIHPERGDHHHDATRPIREWRLQFDTVVYDPPYRMSGTRAGTDFDDRYGLDGPAPTAANILEGIQAGTRTAARCTRPGGTILVKCQDQVCSGRKHWQTAHVTRAAEHTNCTLIDRFDMIRPGRPQPAGRPQKHSRSNTSTLLVFRKRAA